MSKETMPLNTKSKIISTKFNDRYFVRRQSDLSAGSFVKKLYNMVENEPNDVISWIKGGTAFHIKNPKVLAECYLPKYFRHSRFSSLIRQLNFYSFYKIQEGNAVIYQHSLFRKGRRDLLRNIRRRGAGKAKEPLYDPISGRIQRSMPCTSPTATACSISTMSPPHKPGLPFATPPELSLDGKETLKRSLEIDSKIDVIDSLDKKTVCQIEPAIDITSFLSEEIKNSSGVESLKSKLDDSSSTTCITGISLLSRGGKLAKEGSSEDWRKKKDVIDIEYFPTLTDDTVLWDRPLSPLNLPDQNSSWLDLEF